MKARFNSRAAAYVAGVVTLMEIVPCLTLVLDRLVQGYDAGIDIKDEFRTIIYVSFGMYTLFAVMSLVFVVGIKMDHSLLFVPWMTWLVALIVFETVAITIHKQTANEALRKWELAFMISFIIRLVINIVALVIAMYHYKEMSEGRGTSQEMTRRRMARLAARRNGESRLTTVTDGRNNGPPGVTLKPPPYLEKPPVYGNDEMTPPYNPEYNTTHQNISLASDLLQIISVPHQMAI
ncbi:uncharacterized protein LOC135493943 [Lineus longissimus]|uniref:uncharacterized protein LOC135493943 n=1 Tax=Lineus longissimus TaxID=88925 RepID=UPI00315D1FF4